MAVSSTQCCSADLIVSVLCPAWLVASYEVLSMTIDSTIVLCMHDTFYSDVVHVVVMPDRRKKGTASNETKKYLICFRKRKKSGGTHQITEDDKSCSVVVGGHPGYIPRFPMWIWTLIGDKGYCFLLLERG